VGCMPCRNGDQGKVGGPLFVACLDVRQEYGLRREVNRSGGAAMRAATAANAPVLASHAHHSLSNDAIFL
jgi:hypothetical protein